MVASQTTSRKKLTPAPFKKNGKQYNPRPILKNADPFLRSSRHPSRLIDRKTLHPVKQLSPMRHHRVRGVSLRRRFVKQIDLARRLLPKRRRKPRAKSKLFIKWSILMRKLRASRRRRSSQGKRYWVKRKSAIHHRKLRTVAVRRYHFYRSPHAFGVSRPHKASISVTAKRVILRTFRPVLGAPWLTKHVKGGSKGKRAEHWHNLHFATAKVKAMHSTFRLRLQTAQRKGISPSLSLKTLRKVVRKHSDRRKRHKRSRIDKRPALKNGTKQRVLARQLIRKLRSVQRTATRALRHRLLRHKYRYYRKARTRFDNIRYMRRLRVKRRAVRRARRYLRSTSTILRGARTRVLQRRAIARSRRLAYAQISQHRRLLLLNSAAEGGRQTYRQLLFIRKEQRRYARAMRLLISNASRPAQIGVVQNGIRARHANAKLRRHLTSYTASRAVRLPRPRSELTPKPFTIASTWLLRRQQRVWSHRRNLPDHSAELLRLKRYRAFRVATTSLLRQLPQMTFTKTSVPVKNRKQQLLQLSADGLLLRLNSLSIRATLAAFRASAAHENRPTLKNTVQTSRVAALTLRNERVRLLEARYYRTRAKLRLPNQRVRRSERKRQGLRLFARHTLKRPTTVAGRGKLLLPALARYTATPRPVVHTPVLHDSDISVPERMRAYHPRVHFRGPRRYELGLILTNRLRKQAKKGLRRRRFLKAVLQGRKLNLKKGEAATITLATQYNTEKLATVIQKTQQMDASTFTKQFFKTLTFCSTSQQEVAKAVFLSRLEAAHLKLSSLKKLPTRPLNRTHRAGALERLALKTTRLANSSRRELALWHLRSVQGMLKQERNLSAWSPQYGTNFRRWSSPRRYGLPMRPRKLSRLALKLRRLINKALASRNRPKRKHFDRSFGRIQYYRGSAASLGYSRYRRVYRPRSKSNRWWKPLKHGVPFTHPYSRRALNSKKDTQVNLKRALGYRQRGAAVHTNQLTSRWQEPEEKPRLILSSTVKFKRKHYETRRMFMLRVKQAREKMPFTLQRWLPIRLRATGKVEAAAYTKTILARTRRSIRKLEHTFPKNNLWAGHRWEALNSSESTTSTGALFTAATRQFSPSFWVRLRLLADTRAKCTALQSTLFARFRSWHKNTLPSVVVGGKGYTQRLTLAAKFIIATVGELLHGKVGNSLYSDLDNDAFTRRLTSKQHRSWKLRQLNTARGSAKGRSTSIYTKKNNVLRRRWLYGAERYLKHNRVGRLPPRHRRGGDRRLTNYGRSRRRFPASGRRKQSYDSMLHAFAKRISPARFRRAAVTRFQRIHPRVTRDPKINSRSYELTRRRRLQRRVASTLSRVAYLSPAWRELLVFRESSPVALPTADHTITANETLPIDNLAIENRVPYTTQYGQPFSIPSKQRFASLPVNVLFKRAQSARRLLRPSELLPLRAHQIGLLRTALRRRRMERLFVDLKKHTSRRRLAKERLTPAWKRRKLARKREKYLRYGDWTARHFWLKPSRTIPWTLHSLEERAPRRQERALDISLRSVGGELLLLSPQTAKRRNWAKKGFRIQFTTPRIKPRRSRTVIRRRYRHSRHPRLGGRAKFRHWSERKNYKKIVLRGLRSKKATNHSAARYAYHTRAGFLPHKKLKRGAVFLSKQTGGVKLNLHSRLTFRSSTLSPFSSLTHRWGLKRLQRRAAHRRSKFLRRKVRALRRQHRLSESSQHTSSTNIRQQATRALRPFVENLIPRTAIAPLTFVRRTRRAIKTEVEKQRAIVWNIKNKEIRYKKTAQYTEALTQFIPALMSYMLSRHIIHKKLTYSYIKGLIGATYWNLRIYLNVDPFAGRLALRDRNFKQLRFLTKAITRLAKEQITDHANRMRLRWRFQPCRLQPAPSSDRFRLDWLRVFFPRKHALYQEDPEYYSRVALSSRHIRRVPLTGYGIGRARTYSSTTSVERRARQLLRMRLSRREPRLETVLQTIRRVPETELEQFVPTLTPDSEEVLLERERVLTERAALADAAAFARSKKFVFVKKARAPKLSTSEAAAIELDHLFEEHITERNPIMQPRLSFFQRHYSTSTMRALTSTAKLIALQGRLSAADGEQSTAFSELSARARVKSRLVARGRTNFVAATDFMINAGGLDPRFLRYKSPRSRQYEVRKSAVLATSNRPVAAQLTDLTRLQQKRATLWPQRENKQALRLRRRHFYLDTPTSATSHVARVLTTVRGASPSRRIPTALHSRIAIARQRALNIQVRIFPNRKQLTFASFADHDKDTLFRKEMHLFKTRPLLKGQLLQYWRSNISAEKVIFGERAALLYRTPAQRLTSSMYRADRVLAYRPIRPRSGPTARSKAGKRIFHAAGKAQRRYKRAIRGLRFAWTGSISKLKRKISAKCAARVFTKLQHLSRSRAVPQDRLFPNKELRSTQATHFYVTALKRVARLSRFTRRCIIRQRIDYQTPFDTYRPQLWHMLTHRWMKKHRILKEWLKEVDHWFKDPWLSLLVDPTRRGKRVPGEIRAREQQDGEVVTGGENVGYTAEEKALRVKAAHQAIAGALAVVKKDLEHTKRHADRAPTSKKVKILMRLKRSRQVLRKPRPSMWLANLQCKRWVAEKAAWIAKPKKDKQAHLLARKKLSIESVKSGKGPLGPKAAPLKVPADHFIPRVIWKDIHRRVRRLTWRESDDAFTRRGFRNAFKFYPAERNRAPWLEALMYNRSLYSTNLREFRRHQFPREQKKYKWLQRVRKGLFPGRTHVYIKGRRWPRLRTYNQRLHYSLFNLPDRNAARRHFKKLSRRSRTVGFVRSQEGLSNRLDNVLVHLNMAPTIFWARHVATRGLLRINGKIVYGADYQLKGGDFIEPVWDKVIKYRHFFKNPLQRREEKFRHHRWSPTGVPRNFEYHPTIRCYTFLGNPREEDLRRSSRLQPHLFRWFRLDSGAKKSIT